MMVFQFSIIIILLLKLYLTCFLKIKYNTERTCCDISIQIEKLQHPLQTRSYLVSSSILKPGHIWFYRHIVFLSFPLLRSLKFQSFFQIS